LNFEKEYLKKERDVLDVLKQELKQEGIKLPSFIPEEE